MTESTKKSSAGMILLAWLLVGVPLSWGGLQHPSKFDETLPDSTSGRRARSAHEMIFIPTATKNYVTLQY